MFAPLPASGTCILVCGTSQIVIQVTGLGLLLAVLEFFVALPDEVNLIWVLVQIIEPLLRTNPDRYSSHSRPFRLTFTKLLYVICRYFGLTAHV